TEKVREFQSFYNLTINGIADEVTLSKIDELLQQPLSKGMKRKDVKQLKHDLAELGFSVPGNGTTLYGEKTEEKVKEFQTYYSLEVTGVVYESTQAKIEEILSSPLQNGKRHQKTVQMKKDLAQLGFAVPGNGTTLDGENTTEKVREFQSFYNLTINGIADEVTLSKIDELLQQPLSKGMKRKDVKQLKHDLAELGFSVPGNGTTLYGEKTEEKVKEFQSYYSLEVTGIVYESTQAKIEEILSSPLQKGRRHQSTVQLKKDLAQLGFAVPGNGTTLYGESTTRKVKELQIYYNLKVNGIADEVTLEKIEEILSSPLQNGQKDAYTVILKKNLDKLGFTVPGNGTTLYGKNTMKKVKEFQSHYKLKVNGIADAVTLAKIDEILSSPLQNGKRHKDVIKLKNNLAKIGYKVSNNPTTLYGNKTEKRVKEFQQDYKLPQSGIADEITLKLLNQKVEENPIKVFLDPGHGGKDPGAKEIGRASCRERVKMREGA